MIFQQDDGGRADAGFKGHTGDCVVRAIAIATQQPYRLVYDDLHETALADRVLMARLELRYGAQARRHASPRSGVHRRAYDAYMTSQGWLWQPTMRVGSGCQVHLVASELPAGRLVARLSGHMCAVIDGVIHDLYDPSRNGTRCVYGYWHNHEGA